MPIQVACGCGKTYTFKDEVAGRRVKCPACGQAIRVPGQASAPPAPEEETGRRFSRAEIVAFAVAGVAVLALAIIIPAFLIYGGAKPLAPKEPAAKSAVAAAPAEKPAQPAAPAAKTPAETPAPPSTPAGKTPAEKTPAETPAQPAAPPEKAPAEPAAATKRAPPVRPAAGGFKVEPFDPAALKAGQYAGRTVCWKGKVLAVKSAQPGIVSVLVYEQGTDRVEADLRFHGNLIAGVGAGKTIVFEGTVERPAAGETAPGAPALALTDVRVDLAALAAEMTAPAAPAAPAQPAPEAPAEKAPEAQAETPATPKAPAEKAAEAPPAGDAPAPEAPAGKADAPAEKAPAAPAQPAPPP